MRILLYTGKGGVGKTSISAATAVRCAELGYRTIVLSTFMPGCISQNEKTEWAALAWTEMTDPPESLVRGTNRFGLEGLTLYASHYRHVISSDLGDQPDAGNVFLRQVRVLQHEGGLDVGLGVEAGRDLEVAV